MALQTRGEVLAVTLGLFLAAGACRAGDMRTMRIKLGEKMLDFSLPDANGTQRSLYELSGKKAVAVVFIATRCPYSNAFNSVMAKLAREYASRGVAFVGVNSNKSESIAEVDQHARDNGFAFPVLKDEGNLIADRLGASVTPEVFLVDGTWTLRYHGALGNSQRPTTKAEEASDAEVRAALEAVLAGKEVAQPETKAFGCTIKRL